MSTEESSGDTRTLQWEFFRGRPVRRKRKLGNSVQVFLMNSVAGERCDTVVVSQEEFAKGRELKPVRSRSLKAIRELA